MFRAIGLAVLLLVGASCEASRQVVEDGDKNASPVQDPDGAIANKNDPAPPSCTYDTKRVTKLSRYSDDEMAEGSLFSLVSAGHGDQFAVIWNRYDSVTRMHARLFTKKGDPLSDEAEIARPRRGATIGADPKGFALCWDTKAALYFGRLSSVGRLDDEPINLGTAYHDLCVDLTPTDEGWAALGRKPMQTNGDDPQTFTLLRMTAAGEWIGESEPVTALRKAAGPCRMAPTNQGYLVACPADVNELALHSFDRQGRIQGTTQRISNAARPQLYWTGSKVLLTYLDYREHPRKFFVQVVDARGQLIGDAKLIATSRCEQYAATWTGSELALIWLKGICGGLGQPTYNGLYLSRVSQSGEAIGSDVQLEKEASFLGEVLELSIANIDDTLAISWLSRGLDSTENVGKYLSKLLIANCI